MADNSDHYYFMAVCAVQWLATVSNGRQRLANGRITYLYVAHQLHAPVRVPSAQAPDSVDQRRGHCDACPLQRDSAQVTHLIQLRPPASCPLAGCTAAVSAISWGYRSSDQQQGGLALGQLQQQLPRHGV
eukprot:5608-Heterococcus_DN1.PRE.1